MNLPTTPQMAKAYQDILLQEARGIRLSGTVRAARPRLRDRLLVGAGDWLIATGQNLQQRAKAPVTALPEPCAQISSKISV
jgi:hypothetical protein